MGKRIADLVRAGNREGNPVWAVTFTDGQVARTEPGSQVAFSIDNPEYQDADLEVAFNDAGRIVGVAVA